MRKHFPQRAQSALLWTTLAIALLAVFWAQAPFAPAVSGEPARAARNVILLVGDGMGHGQVEAGRRAAAEHGRPLAMDSMPIRSRVSTLSHGGVITDSAAASTAMATGCKTLNGYVGISPSGERLPNVSELVKAAGGMVGLVTNCGVPSATLAGFVVHAADRGSMREIARAMVQAMPDVMLGGGAAYFMPTPLDQARPALEEALHAGYAVIMEKHELEAASALPLLGLFAMTDMPYELDRDPACEPGLRQMVEKAIGLLAASAKDAGFFLMVEGGRIDHACHANDLFRLPAEVAAFDDAVSASLDFARQRGDTLVIVTADHETGQLEASGDGGLRFGTDGHTGTPVPLFAEGPGQEWFDVGAHVTLDNTDIARLISRALGMSSQGAKPSAGLTRTLAKCISLYER